MKLKVFRVFHFDLYRISEAIELEEIGIDEYLSELKTARSSNGFQMEKPPFPHLTFVQISYKNVDQITKRIINFMKTKYVKALIFLLLIITVSP